MQNEKRAARKRCIALAYLLAANLVVAQTAKNDPTSPDRNTTTTAEGETIVLSPFTVNSNADKGYRATNSTSGTRLNTPIKELPLSLEVITNEFMRDTGATNLREALRYSPGVVLQSQFDGLSGALTNTDTPDTAQANNPESATRDRSGSTVKIRGFITDQVLRDGFRRQQTADTANIERIEVLRGPSALLYGIGNFGGIVNYIPKRPTQKPSYRAEVMLGSDSFYRAEFQASLGEFYKDGDRSAAFALYGAAQKNEDFTDFANHKHWFLSPVAVIKPFKDTTITLEAEIGEARDEGIGFQNVRSSVVASGFPYQTNARRLDFYTPPGVDPRTFRWSGPDTFRENPTRNYYIDLTQRFTDDLWLKAGLAQSSVKYDSSNIWYGTFNTLDPFNRDSSGAVTGVNSNNALAAQLPRYYKAPANATQQLYLDQLSAAVAQGGTQWVDVFNARPANFWLGDIYGTTFTSRSLLKSQGAPVTTYFTTLNYQWAEYNSDEDRRQARVELNYKFDAGFLGKHSILAGLQYMDTQIEQTNFGQSPDLAVGAPVSSDPIVWNYKSPNDATPIRRNVQGDGTTPSVASKPITWTLDKRWDLGYYAVYQGQFWKDRINLIGGVRWDRNDARGYAQRLWLAGSKVEITDRASKDNLYEPQEDAPSKISPQVGLSVGLTKNFSVYGLYSTGLLPNPAGTLDGNGQQFGPITAKNYEVGLKFSVLDGRISGSIAGFKIKRDNIPRSIWWAPAPGVPAALSGHIANYDKSKPTTIGFYDWGSLNPYYAWYASKSDLNAKAPWTKIYPAMAQILSNVPTDPSRKWGGYALPLGMKDLTSTPSSMAVDAAGNPLGKTVAQVWTEYAQAHGTMPAMPAGGSPQNPFFVNNATDPWTAAWVNTYGLMVSDKTKGETAAQDLYDMFWQMNATSLQAALGANGRDPNAQVHGWGGQIPWLWGGDGAVLPYYPGYWNDPNAQPTNGSAGPYSGVMNSMLGMNSAKVPFSDETKGFEVQLNISPIDNWQIVLGYAHLNNKNTTSTLRYVPVDDPTGNTRYGLWATPGESFGTTYFTREEAFTNPDDPTTYQIPPNDYGLALDDTPEDTVTVWTKYTFTHGPLKGFGIGGGGVWESERLYDASVSVDGSVTGSFDPETRKLIADQLYTPSRVRYSLLLEYTMRVKQYRVRTALNIDNLLNDKDRYGYIYAPGRSWRLSTSIEF
ncbi:MAG TPA: TonB-dependent receptor plug domain-containing protein [Opitutaceae bacterium]|nr:TonB-dependent receptor plug domain-containing protein [Opitutaceae bacterium]